MKKILFLMMWLFAGCSACEEDAAVQPKLVHDERPVCEQIGVPCSFSEARPEAHTESMALLEDIAKWAANDESIEQIHARLKNNKNLVALSFDEANKLIAYRFEGGLYYTYGEYTSEGSKHDYMPLEQFKQETWLANTSHSDDDYSKYALILAPFHFEFAPYDEALNLARLFRGRQEYKHPDGVVLDYQPSLPEYNSKATLRRHLDRYRNWSKKDYIHISTHGGIVQSKKPFTREVNGTIHQYTSAFSLSAIVLPKGMTCDVLKTVFKADEDGISCGITTVKTSKDEKKHQRSVISVNSWFFEDNNGTPFINQVVYVSACLILSRFQSRGGTFLPVSSGGVLFGYTNSVKSNKAMADARSIVTRLLQGHTPAAARNHPVRGTTYSNSLQAVLSRNLQFVLRGKGVPSPGLRIIEPVRVIHPKDAQVGAGEPIRDVSTMKVLDDEQGAKRLLKGEVEIEGLGIDVMLDRGAARVCEPAFGKRSKSKWPLHVMMVLLEQKGEFDVEELTESITIKKDELYQVGDTNTYRVPFEMVLKKVPTKPIEGAKLRVWVEYPFEGLDFIAPNAGDMCGGGWIMAEEFITIDPFELKEHLDGRVSGALQGVLNNANMTFEPKCIFPGVIDNNYLLKWEAEFDNGFGQLEDVYIVLQVNEGVHKPGVQEYGELSENKEATILSVNTSAGFTPSADTHHRSYQNPVRGTVNVVSFPTDLEPGWFAASVNVQLESNDPQVATGQVELEFDVAHYFDRHPCKQ